MKKTPLCIISLVLYLQSFAQFPLHFVMPMGVSGIDYGDTILNRTIILKQENIKKIIADETTIKGKYKTFSHTEYNLLNGKIISKHFCLHQSSKPDWCNGDTIIYDSNGRLLEIRMLETGGTAYLQEKIAYLSDDKITRTWIIKTPTKAASDTDIYLCSYNQKGQLTRQEMTTKRFAGNDATLFYNEDGLIESIKHDNPGIGNYIFTRNQKGRSKEISLETKGSFYKWEYNAEGQCIHSEWSTRPSSNPRNKPYQGLSMKASYYYNSDGTLSKVVEKASNKRVSTTVYSYTRQ
jgi:hypothetical protein